MVKDNTKNVGGRPTIYTEELIDTICIRLANGESLKKISEDPTMPTRSTIHRWLLDEKKKEFWDKYESAINVRTENMFDELTEIADDGTNDYMTRTTQGGEEYEVVNNEHIQRSRLRTDVRKWYLSKVMPKKYGDKVDVTTGGKPIPILNLADLLKPDAVLPNNSNKEDSDTEEED